MSGPQLGQGYHERVPLVLVLDTSDSMARPAHAPRIAELTAALGQWLADARTRPSLRTAVEIAIVTFGSAVQVVNPATGEPGALTAADPATAFAPASEVTDPVLAAGGYTPMLPAIDAALDLARQRRDLLKRERMPSRRPMLWLVTDGAATDADGTALTACDLAPAAARLRAAELAPDPDERCLFFAIGVGAADRELLRVLAPQTTMMLDGFRFRDILGIVSDSADRVQSSDPPDHVYEKVDDLVRLAEEIRGLEERHLLDDLG